MPGNLADAASSLGGAVSDLFGASGSSAAASSYDQAAQIAAQNEKLSEQQTNIQETQAARQIYQTIGTQQTQVAGAGFASSGSALDLLKSSQSQGALTKAMIREEGDIQANSYAEQAGLYKGLAGAASATSTAQTIGGIIQAGNSIYQGYNAVTGLFGGSAAPITDLSTVAPSAAADAAITGAGADAAVGAGAAVGTDVATGVATDVAAGVGADVAAGVGADVAAGAAADIGAGVGADVVVGGAADAGIFSGLGDVLLAAVAWVVCTELVMQKRMPVRWYAAGAKRFAAYSERDLRGYYAWAIPAVRHLRAHPASRLSSLLEWTFNHRAEYIAAQAGVRGARKTLAGWVTLAGVHALCWTLARTVARQPQDWTSLYRA